MKGDIPGRALERDLGESTKLVRTDELPQSPSVVRRGERRWCGVVLHSIAPMSVAPSRAYSLTACLRQHGAPTAVEHSGSACIVDRVASV